MNNRRMHAMGSTANRSRVILDFGIFFPFTCFFTDATGEALSVYDQKPPMGTVTEVVTTTIEEIKVPKEVVKIGDWIERDRKELRRKIKKTDRKKEKLVQRLAEMPELKGKLVPFTVVDVQVQQTVVVAPPPSN